MTKDFSIKIQRIHVEKKWIERLTKFPEIWKLVSAWAVWRSLIIKFFLRGEVIRDWTQDLIICKLLKIQ